MARLKHMIMYVLAVALCHFGMVGTVVHAHEYTEDHLGHWHLIGDHGHEHAPSDADGEPGENDSAPSTSPLHGHSVPQFNPTEQPVIPAVTVSFVCIDRPGPDTSVKGRQENPPFKPPRALVI